MKEENEFHSFLMKLLSDHRDWLSLCIDLFSVYRIAGNFRGVKLSRNNDHKVFAGLIFSRIER